MRVDEALALPALRQGLPEVVAGHDALDREVRWAHVVEIDDVTDLLSGGELILTTGRGSGSEPRDQHRFVEILAAEGAAALVVELGTTYRRVLPRHLVLAAEHHGLPLIALRRRIPFVAATQAITSAVLSDELLDLRHADDVLHRLVEVLQRGDGIGGLLAELARAVRNPVVLEDAGGHLVRVERHDAREDVVLSAWEDAARAERRGEDAPGVRAVDVRVDARTWGRLLALELDAPFHGLDQVALERGVVVLGLALQGRRQHELTRNRGASDVLANLRVGRITPADAERRAATVGFPRRPTSLVPIVAVWRRAGWTAIAEDAEFAWSNLAANVRTALKDDGWHALVGPHGAELLVVVTADEARDTSSTEARDRIASCLHGALARRGLREEDVAVAIGPTEPGWDGLVAALDRTAQGAGAGAAGEPTPWTDASRTDVVDLLFAMRSGPQLSEFVRDRLGPLMDADNGLLHTLEVYLAEGGSKARAARALHLERQSLYYRLGRIEEILGVSLEDEEAVLGLRLALRASRLLSG